MFYSKSTSGFYDTGIHSEIPSDAVEITYDEHAALLDGQSKGKRIVADADGRPMLADPPPPSEGELAAQVRSERDGKLTATNWLIERHHEQLSAGIATSIADEAYRALLTYRQALRDVPAQAGFPAAVTWPVAPL